MKSLICHLDKKHYCVLLPQTQEEINELSSRKLDSNDIGKNISVGSQECCDRKITLSGFEYCSKINQFKRSFKYRALKKISNQFNFPLFLSSRTDLFRNYLDLGHLDAEERLCDCLIESSEDRIIYDLFAKYVYPGFPTTPADSIA